jgi:hypothetical protein
LGFQLVGSYLKRPCCYATSSSGRQPGIVRVSGLCRKLLDLCERTDNFTARIVLAASAGTFFNRQKKATRWREKC